MCGQRRYRIHIRHETAAPRNSVHIVECIRVKAREADTVDEDVCQQSIAALHAGITNRIGTGSATFCINQHFLRLGVLVILHYRLSFTRRHCHYRQRSTFVECERIVERLRCEDKYLTFDSHILQRSVTVFLNDVLHRIGSLRAILSNDGNTPLAVRQLTKEYHLSTIRRLITDFRI